MNAEADIAAQADEIREDPIEAKRPGRDAERTEMVFRLLHLARAAEAIADSLDLDTDNPYAWGLVVRRLRAEGLVVRDRQQTVPHA